jgi:hypothetical protein
MKHYWTFHAERPWCRVLAVESNFEARKVAAGVCPGSTILDFYAIRADLLSREERRKGKLFGA